MTKPKTEHIISELDEYSVMRDIAASVEPFKDRIAFEKGSDFGYLYARNEASQFRSCMCSKYLEEIARLQKQVSDITSEWTSVCEEITTLKEELSIKEEFLFCYKTGKQPTEKLWKRVEKNKLKLTALKKHGE